MIPEGFATIYAFLGLVTPGLVYQLLRERARPALQETSFREASRVALTSAALTTAAILTVVVLARWRASWFVDVDEWLRRGDDYLGSETARVVWTVVVTVLLACAYAVLTHLAANALSARNKTRIENSDVWYQLFVDDVPKGFAPWVVIKTQKGTWIWGHVDFFTIGKPLEDREISLKGPQLAIEEPDTGATKTEHYWQRICVRASEIALLKVAYEPLKTPLAARRFGRAVPRRAVDRPGQHAAPVEKNDSAG